MSQGSPSGKTMPPALYSWSEVWTAAITRPAVATYVELLRDPAATLRRAYIWLYVTGSIVAFIVVYLLLNDPDLLTRLPEGITADDVRSSMVLTMLCAIPLAGAISVFMSMLLATAIHFVIQRLEPDKKLAARYPALFYVLAAIVAPLSVVNILLTLASGAAPAGIVGDLLMLLTLALSIYQLVLMAIGVRAVYDIALSKAALAIAVPLILTILVLRLIGY